MKTKISNMSKSASRILHELSAMLGVSDKECAWRLAERYLEGLDQSYTEGMAVVAAEQAAAYECYRTRRDAEKVAERINERSVVELLEGKSQFLVSAEVVEADGFYCIKWERIHSNSDGWSSSNS
jgi:hypothetical protein